MTETSVQHKQLDMVPTRTSFDGMTMGTVVDTNDPRQMGRLRVLCPALGDTNEMEIRDIPWAIYVSPFGGMTDTGTRGPSDDENDESSNGPIAYGMFNVPKMGANVLVACLDGNGEIRLWLGCVHAPLMTHTMPHGLYSYQSDGHLPDGGNAKPEGPMTSQNEPVNPLYDNQTTAFTATKGEVDAVTVGPRLSYEFRTRAADKSVCGLTTNTLDQTPHSFIFEDQGVSFSEPNGNVLTNTQGYETSRVEPYYVATNLTDGINYDPQTYSWTTPGFHSISMDDRAANCRTRFRTTSGHQIILDDTNERIYISTAEGKTWVELDQKGNIDVYAERNLSFRAQGDINFTTDQTFRVNAKQGIHMFSNTENRIHSAGKTTIRSNDTIDIYSDDTLKCSSKAQVSVVANKKLYLSSNIDVNVVAAFNVFLGAGENVDFIAGDTLHISSRGNMDVRAQDLLRVNATEIHLNSEDEDDKILEATEAIPPVPGPFAEDRQSYWTSRVPQHEPWTRNFMLKGKDPDVTGQGGEPGADRLRGNTHVPEYDYDSPDIGLKSQDREEEYDRNSNWHR